MKTHSRVLTENNLRRDAKQALSDRICSSAMSSNAMSSNAMSSSGMSNSGIRLQSKLSIKTTPYDGHRYWESCQLGRQSNRVLLSTGQYQWIAVPICELGQGILIQLMLCEGPEQITVDIQQLQVEINRVKQSFPMPKIPSNTKYIKLSLQSNFREQNQFAVSIGSLRNRSTKLIVYDNLKDRSIQFTKDNTILIKPFEKVSEAQQLRKKKFAECPPHQKPLLMFRSQASLSLCSLVLPLGKTPKAHKIQTLQNKAKQATHIQIKLQTLNQEYYGSQSRFKKKSMWQSTHITRTPVTQDQPTLSATCATPSKFSQALIKARLQAFKNKNKAKKT